MFTTNLSIIIITGTGAGHEPQTKVQGLMRKLSSTVLWLDLNPRTHGVGATRMVFLQSTTRAYTARTSIRGLARSMEPMTSRKAHHHQVLSGSIRGWILPPSKNGRGFIREKGIDSALLGHHRHPSGRRLLFGRGVSSLSLRKSPVLHKQGSLRSGKLIVCTDGAGTKNLELNA